MLMNVYELYEFQQREGCAFLTGMNDFTFVLMLMSFHAIPTSILPLAKVQHIVCLYL
jgi:hypothetical protein